MADGDISSMKREILITIALFATMGMTLIFAYVMLRTTDRNNFDILSWIFAVSAVLQVHNNYMFIN